MGEKVKINGIEMSDDEIAKRFDITPTTIMERVYSFYALGVSFFAGCCAAAPFFYINPNHIDRGIFEAIVAVVHLAVFLPSLALMLQGVKNIQRNRIEKEIAREGPSDDGNP